MTAVSYLFIASRIYVEEAGEKSLNLGNLVNYTLELVNGLVVPNKSLVSKFPSGSYPSIMLYLGLRKAQIGED